MKSVLLYANVDVGLESRLQAALDVVRAFDGHLTCLQVTPFNTYMTGDPFGGVYALPIVMEQVQTAEEAHRAHVEDRLRNEGINWDWDQKDGMPAQRILERSGLADLIVLSLPAADDDGPLSITADVAIHARAPVLAVPRSSRSLDVLAPAILAWNGSSEASHALRLARTMLERSSAVHVVTVVEEETEFPAVEACSYLARYGIEAELHELGRDGRSTAETIIDAAATLDAGFVVMGAYGHTRMREAVFGGVTRELLRHSPVPLVLAH
jgi:nucleotide-binding universal stress UspA family protein